MGFHLSAVIRLVMLIVVGGMCLAPTAMARQSPETRLALVISQTNYTGNLSRVALAEQEAEQVAASLSTAKFSVKRARDLSQPQMRVVLDTFRREVEQAGSNAVAFVYYTGHGVSHPQTHDSYLLGVDAQLQSVSDLPTFGVDLQTLRDGFGATGAKAVFLVFDACRDVPGLPGWKSGRKGLQRVDARADMLVAFSTGLNTPAREGSYAPVLAEELRRSGQSAVAAFDAVQRRVAERSAREQLPWFDSQLYKQVCFISCTPGGELPVVAPAPASAAASPPPIATPSRPTILTFETMKADTQALGFEIPPCTLSGSTLECAVFVTAKQKYEWYFNDKSHLLDENGAVMPVASMTIGGETRTTTNWGYKVEWRDLMPGARTRIVYRFSGIRQPEKLQALAVSLLFNEFATIRWDGQ